MDSTTSVCTNPEQLAAEKGVDLGHELTKGFAARFVRRKAKQLIGKAGFTPSDRPELEQELKLGLIRALTRFDPAKRHWNVFVTTVIERRIASILESRRAKKSEFGQNITSLSTPVPGDDDQWTELGRLIPQDQKEGVTGRVTSSFEDQVDLALDVQTVIYRLPDDLRDLCVRLMSASVSQVARDLRVPQSTLNDKVRRLRDAFETAGVSVFPGSIR